MKTFRIVTFNTWNCQGNLQSRLPLMASGLRGLSADIILLQEVFSEVPSGLNVADHLAEALDMKAAFIPARKKLREFQGHPVLCHSGLAILTCGEIVGNAKVHLPQDERDGERLAQYASIQIGDTTVLVVNTHLSHLSDADALRRQELDVLLAHLNTCPEHDLTVVGGDMNADETDRMFDLLGGFRSYPIQSSSDTTLNAVNAEVPKPGFIDHLFISTRHRDIDAYTSLALDEKDIGADVFPSDHKAVVLDISLDLS